MKICFLSSMHSPQDKRVFDKEAVSLAQAGFDVTHLAPGFTDTRHEQGVQIVTYEPPQGLIDRVLQIPRLYRLASRLKADVFHCNEVDSWFVGVLLKCVWGAKVVFDVHEHYPSTLAEKHFPLWLRPLITGSTRLLFHVLTPFTDRLVFAKKSVAPDFKGSETKQVLVQNFTLLSFLSPPDEMAAIPEPDSSDSDAMLTAIHLGLINRVRGWPQILDALDRAKSKNIRLHIVGTFDDGSQGEFEIRLRELGLEDRVYVEDWLPFGQAYQRLEAADIGLVMFQPVMLNHVYAMPHKMFDYMLAQLPVIAPDFAEEVAPIIAEADCGILVDPSDPDQVATALDHLATHPAARRQLGHNGRQAVFDHYNWEAEAEKLIKMYTELADESQ